MLIKIKENEINIGTVFSLFDILLILNYILIMLKIFDEQFVIRD